MNEYDKGYSILKFDGSSRAVSPLLLVGDDSYLLSVGINPCDYTYTHEVIDNLEKLVAGEIHEYEWGGGERTWFVSGAESTKAIDNFERYEDIELLTKLILEMMIARKEMMEQLTENEILNLIKQSFEEIKIDPKSYLYEPEACLYKINDDRTGLFVLMVLLEEDFKLTADMYCEELKFNKRFFVRD
jgi:hypothetical protein